MKTNLALAEPSRYSRALIAGLQPDPIETISEWADKHMVLPSWASESGPWRTSRTPYLKEIMDCLSPMSPCRKVVFMKPAQIGGTSTGTNWIAYAIHRAPAPFLVVEPTVDLAKKLSKQKIQPMLDDVEVLRGRVREARERDSGNTILSKDFTGGMLVLTGANSGPGLRFMSAKYLFLDEVDGYPHDVDGEGSPIELAENRTTTYFDHKIFLASTPLDKLTSIIEPEWEASDRRRFYVPCPFCGFLQVLCWAGLKWPKDDPGAARYECENCHQHIAEHHKTWMLSEGRWIAERPEILDVAGFRINGLYSPYGWSNSWGKLAKKWVKITHSRNNLQRKAFINTVFAETWEEEGGDKINSGDLRSRREAYPAAVPAGVIVLTAAVDVQDDRLEAEVVGWGMGEESWSIDYRQFHGSPARPDVWDQVDRFLLQTWRHESGVGMKVAAACIDTGGNHTREAYTFVKNRQRRRIFAIKGSSQHGHPIVGRSTRTNIARVSLFPIGTDAAKDTIFANFKLDTFGPGYCHFPDLPQYDEEYFAQLTGESRKSKYDRGVLVGYAYKKNRARNEALDLRVYNVAALTILNPNFEKIAEGIEQKAEVAKKEGEGGPAEEDGAKQDPPRDRNDPIKRESPWKRKQRAGWMNRWTK